MFLERVNNHPRCNMLHDPSHYVLQALDYVEHIDIYHERIKMIHVKDAELNPTGRQCVYGGYQSWLDCAGRFRSLGDSQVDFSAIFSKFAQYDFAGWAVLEWECCLKHPEDGAREGAKFINDHIIRVTERAIEWPLTCLTLSPNLPTLVIGRWNLPATSTTVRKRCGCFWMTSG